MFKKILGYTLILGLVLNFGLKLWSNAHYELNLDEATDFWVARGQWDLGSQRDQGNVVDVLLANRHSLSGPLFPMVLHAWSYLGTSAFFLRLLTLLAATAAVVVLGVFFKQRKIPWERNGLYLNLLVWNGALAWDATNLRAYAFLNLILLVSLFYLFWDKDRASKKIVSMGWGQLIAVTLGIWLGYGFLLYLPVLLLAYVFLQSQLSLKTKDLLASLKANLIPGAWILLQVFLLWLTTVRYQPVGYPASYISMLSDYHGLMQVLQIALLIPKLFVWLVLGSWFGWEQLFEILNLDMAVRFMVGATIVLAGIYFLFKNRELLKKNNLIVWVLSGCVLLALVASLFGKFPLGFSRHSHFLIPIGILAFALISEAFIKKSKKNTVTVLVFAAFLILNGVVSISSEIAYLKGTCLKSELRAANFEVTDHLSTNSLALGAAAKHFWRYELGFDLKKFHYGPIGRNTGWVLRDAPKSSCGFVLQR